MNFADQFAPEAAALVAAEAAFDLKQDAPTLAALEAENAMYESINARLDEEIDWLRSLVERVGIEEADDGQTQ